MSATTLVALACVFLLAAGYVAAYMLGYEHGYNDCKHRRKNKVFPERSVS